MQPISDRQKLYGVSVISAAVLILAVVITFYIGRGCAPDPVIVEPVGIDAGPGEAVIAARLDAAVQHADAQLAQLERDHAAEIARFDETQREKYEAIRAGGVDAADRYIREFTLRLRSKDGGVR